jgi:Uma2 family endonuclease
MKQISPLATSQGPFRAGQIRPGDPYELSHGHPILCLPTGGRGARAINAGARALGSDPAVEDLGIDTGFSPAPDTLRAPDLAVGKIPDEPGWVQGVPPLAVEYADTGQDEHQLAAKIRDLLDAGTRFVWVVRLSGPRRVEVHQAGQEVRVARPGEELVAPGILANPVPVEALYDQEVSAEVNFRNLLQRHGYASLEEVRAEGEASSLRTAILDVFAARGLAVEEEVQAAIAGCQDLGLLRQWHRQAVTAASPAELATEVSMRNLTTEQQLVKPVPKINPATRG